MESEGMVMGIPKKAQVLLKELDIEYGENWDLIPETDERLLEIRLLLNIDVSKNGKRGGKGSRRVEWTDEMDTYLVENKDKTAKELAYCFGIDHQIVSRRKKTLGLTSTHQKKNISGILFTGADGKEHHYNNVTDARIATRLPRKTIYKALKIGKEWRYA